MPDPVSVLDAFARAGWRSQPFEQVMAMIEADAATAFDLLALAIERRCKDATFLHAALSHVSEQRLPELARQAVEAFAVDATNEVAEGLIARLSLQQLGALQPHLSQLFELRPNESSYCAAWPWRGASRDDLARLRDILAGEGPSTERVRAFLRILESRAAEECEAALAFVPALELRAAPEAYLAEVGLDAGRRLYEDATQHLVFPMSYLEAVSRPPWLHPNKHPSWILPAEAAVHRFGGVADEECACCGGVLHNLITFSSSPDSLPTVGLAPLEVVTCLSCLGWSRRELYFRHDADGRARPVPTKRSVPEFPAQPLKEADVQLARTPPRWVWQDWALSNSRENLHRVGGHPTWVQSAQYPSCPDCGDLMKAMLQLDSNLPASDGDEWLWGSGGICYVFWCDRCAISASLWQCT